MLSVLTVRNGLLLVKAENRTIAPLELAHRKATLIIKSPTAADVVRVVVNGQAVVGVTLKSAWSFQVNNGILGQWR